MIAWWIGCAPDLDQGSFLTLRGDVSADVDLDGDDAEAKLIWATAVDGELCVELDELTFVPNLFSYEARLAGPPPLDGSPCVPQPVDLDPAATVGFGLLALIDPDRDASAQIRVDPGSLLAWFAGDPLPLIEVIRVDAGRLAAATRSFALIVDGPDTPLFGEPYCRFDQVSEGLTLYQDRGLDCGGWVPVAPAGVRTEYQGVDLVAP